MKNNIQLNNITYEADLHKRLGLLVGLVRGVVKKGRYSVSRYLINRLEHCIER